MRKVTAVVLSINKPDYLRSQLLYYANKPIHIILADGSDLDWGSGRSGCVGEMTWEYLRMPGSNTYFLRLDAAMKRVSTDFVFLLDDEDCILWTGVERAVRFLFDNPDYSSMGGHVAYICKTNKRLGLVSSGHYDPFTLASPSAQIRLDEFLRMRKGPHLYYLIHRTKLLVAYAKSFVDMPPDTHLSALYMSVFLSLTGKVRGDCFPGLIRRQLQERHLSEPRHRKNAKPFFTSRDAIESSERIYKGLLEINELIGDVTTQLTPTVISSFQLRYIGEGKRENTNNRKYVFKYVSRLQSWIGVRVLLPIFDYFPGVYRLLRPNGVMEIKQYVESHVSSTPEFVNDLVLLEQLWLKFRQGVTHEQFLTFLLSQQPDDRDSNSQ